MALVRTFEDTFRPLDLGRTIQPIVQPAAARDKQGRAGGLQPCGGKSFLIFLDQRLALLMKRCVTIALAQMCQVKVDNIGMKTA